MQFSVVLSRPSRERTSRFHLINLRPLDFLCSLQIVFGTELALDAQMRLGQLPVKSRYRLPLTFYPSRNKHRPRLPLLRSEREAVPRPLNGRDLLAIACP
jgi:hypothetical protein